ncbi:cryptococcal mannosyltransferase 1-domain-containing protein [Mycena pura]|uniref:Cryptococcal mannosyltransferase 1-domain-containing protein n=1 Tax=Mycena pura TaxID=153505 RepID=A0AAD6VCE6_9AGAR|nr:cryptococcal mannosyltransferase 1-domain-containing protein [Mycena pura]
MQRLQGLLERTRYAFSRHHIPRPLIPIVQLLAWLLSNAWRVFVRFFSLIASVGCFCFVWRAVSTFYTQKLGVPWAPAFPVPRTAFVITLVAIPIWGAAMTVFMVLSVVVTRGWGSLGGLLGRSRRYEPVALDLDDVEVEETRRRRARDPRGSAHGKSQRARWLIILCLYLSAMVFGVYMLRTYELPLDHRFKERVELANRVPKREGYGTGEKLFIAAIFYNNGGVLPYWIKEITKLIYYLGTDTVFVSIVESNSWDDSPALLEAFDQTLEKMNVARRIITHESTILRPPSMETAPPRIQYLSAVRNLAMSPLVEHGGYTRVLWSNDVFVEAEAIVELLDTKGGEYDMACGLDFQWWGLYDMWVIRDRLGRIASTLWPYFLEDTGFRAVMADEPAPVFACWNGIAAMRADPFLPRALRSGDQLSAAPRARPLAATHPLHPRPANETPAAAPPLRFRASAPGECFSSESFLLPYDLRRVYGLEHIYANPRVVNAYTWEYYVWAKYVLRHWAVKWWIETVENGNGVHLAKMVLGDPARVWQWDGGECHPTAMHASALDTLGIPVLASLYDSVSEKSEGYYASPISTGGRS